MYENEIEVCQQPNINSERVVLLKKLLLSDSEATPRADFFKLLGDVTRLRIVHLLYKNEICVCELAETMEMSQPAISQALKQLKLANLVIARKDGKNVFYTLNSELIKEFIDSLCEISKYEKV